MSRIDELIAELCPNGVEYKALGDICSRVSSGGTPITSRPDYYGGDIPWLRTQEVDYREIHSTGVTITESGLRNSSARWIPANCVIVAMYGATAAKVAINAVPITTNQACCNLEINPSMALHRYVFHWLWKQYPRLRALGEGSQSNLNASKVRSFKIPIPPLEIQEEIVRILDSFSALETELETELETRRRQYAFYRTSLLESLEGGSVKLVDIADLTYGLTEKAADTGSHRFLRITDITPQGQLSAVGAKYVNMSAGLEDFIAQVGDVFMARTGATYGKTMFYDSAESAVFASFLIRIRFREATVLPKFYWHFAQSDLYWSQVNGLVSRAGQPQFNGNALKRLKVPIPPLEEQERIVSILDKFDALVNDLSVGLPAELNARRKQYEYYRDKLLTFKELAA